MFARHRKTLMHQLKGAVGVFFAAPETVRNSSVHNEYRQDSDFFHLTGFDEPEAVLVLAPHREKGEQTIVFLRERDPEREVWDGRRLGTARAPDALGVDIAHDIADLGKTLSGYLVGAEQVYFQLGKRGEDDQVILKAIQAAKRARRAGKQTPVDILDPADLLHEMRLIKSEAGVAAMRQAGALTAAAHAHGMAVTQPGIFEYQIQAAMEYSWRVRGARREAYPSIVGSGPNGCVLHYRDNNRQTEAGDLVLVDAGCEFDYFASDVTRTWPVSGKFSPAQKAIYEIVLDAQAIAIEHCIPGVSFEGVHDQAVRRLTEGLIDLGLLQGSIDGCIEDESYKRFYMHRTGHWIGRDVHDVGRYYLEGTSRALQAGMVTTVEPGIYIGPDDETVPAEFRGIGVRIEDDVLITADGPDVLTSAAPRSVADVEAMVGSARLLGV
jgi:Xaa-Pro aminopeptidase